VNLETGQRLGPYEILALVGAGGMGEVYRARDTRLERTVALKVLPPTLTTSVARARFEREARAIAALSHPHICAIHDVGSENGTEYLVMEFLEGETLADRLARGPLPIQQVARYGAQIAEALQQAHRAGITHRDLKPGNIMITSAGAKLLDFGLAKAIHEEGARAGHDAPTQAGPLTSEGTIVGTFQYMSPEQIEGKSLDHRTDIFALGVVLYEMTTGRRPFAASSSSAVAAAILASDPPAVRSLQPNAPPALERIIVTALEKNPDDRWQTAQDVARQLRWLGDSSSTIAPAAVPQSRRGWVIGLLAVGAILAALAAWSFLPRRASPEAAILRLDLFLPPGIVPLSVGDIAFFALSPDGRTLCFTGLENGERALYLRSLGDDEVRRLDGTTGGAGPFWSPDGRWIGFSARGKLWKTSRAGDSPPRALCDVAVGGANATWGNGVILFSDGPDGRRNIFRVPADGGTPVALTTPSGSEWRHSWPHILPDGEHFLFQAFSAASIERDVVLATLDGRRKAVLLKNVSVARSSGPDELMFVRDGKLLAQRFDAGRGVLTGDPATVAKDVVNFYATASAGFDASPSGVVAYRTETGTSRLSIVDRAGVETKLVGDAARFFDLALSPEPASATSGRTTWRGACATGSRRTRGWSSRRCGGRTGKGCITRQRRADPSRRSFSAGWTAPAAKK
jgi:hypothetical protein